MFHRFGSWHKWSNGRCGIDLFWVYRNCNYLTKQKNMDQNIKEHLDKIVVNIMRWTHVTPIQPFVPFFLISSGDGIWLYKYEANFISNIWVRALCASTTCVSMDICLQLYEDICMLGIGFVPSPWMHIYVIYISLIASVMRL